VVHNMLFESLWCKYIIILSPDSLAMRLRQSYSSRNIGLQYPLDVLINPSLHFLLPGLMIAVCWFLLVYLLIIIRFSSIWFSVTFSTLAIFTACEAAIPSIAVFEVAFLFVPLTVDVAMVLLTGKNTLIVVVSMVFTDATISLLLTVGVIKRIVLLDNILVLDLAGLDWFFGTAYCGTFFAFVRVTMKTKATVAETT